MRKLIILITAVMFFAGDISPQPSKLEDKNLPRILFIGDQITRGINDPSGFGFRDHVQKLLGPGLWNFVGPHSDPTTHLVLDVNHAGDNWNDTDLALKEIKQLLENFMDPRSQNDWVLIHLGTVDIMKNNRIEKFKVGVQGMKKIYKEAKPDHYEMLEEINAKERNKSLGRLAGWKRKLFQQRLKAKKRRELEIDITKVERKQEMTIDEIKENITGLIDDITAFNPHIKIGLAKIIPCRVRGFNEKIKEFNLWIEEMIKRKRELELKNNLFLVDMYDAFTKNPNWGEKLMSSPWYPNEKGYELMASELAKVIKEGSTDGEQGATFTSQSTAITVGASQQELYQVIQSDAISSSSDR